MKIFATILNTCKKFTILLICCLYFISPLFSQIDSSPSQALLDEKTKSEVVNKICEVLTENYLFPEVASKLNAHLLEQLNQNLYDHITSPKQFAEVLSYDLQKISDDRHLQVY